MYEHVRDFSDNTIVRLLRQGWVGPSGSGPISSTKHSAVFNGDNITRDESTLIGVKPFKQTTDGDKGGESPIIKPLTGITIQKSNH